MAFGWLVCTASCGWIGVCRECLVEVGAVVPQEVPWAVCSRHWKFVESGQYRCVDGYVVPVEVVEALRAETCGEVNEEAGEVPVEE